MRRAELTGPQAFLMWLLVTALFYCGLAWLGMISVGMIHAQWLTGMPTVSWHEALALAWIPGAFIAATVITAK